MGKQRHGIHTVMYESSASSTTSTGHTQELRGCECVNVVQGNNTYILQGSYDAHTYVLLGSHTN